MGRLLGPQLMVDGGGHRTAQWFGMYYAGQPGRRIPVPVIQAIEDFAVFCVLIFLERRLERWPDGSRRTGYPPGALVATGMVLWGIERALDEHLWLGQDGAIGSALVQAAGIALAVGGIVLLVVVRSRWRRWLAAGAPGGRAELAVPEDDAPGDDAPEVDRPEVDRPEVGAHLAAEAPGPAGGGRRPGAGPATETTS
jgi:hypothetical protein